MPGLSYNSQNLGKDSSTVTFGKYLVAIAILVTGLLVGFFSNSGLQAYKTRQISNAGHSYVASITAGDLDAAYTVSAESLHSSQTKADFTKSLKGLKSDKPLFAKPDVLPSKDGYTYSVAVDNLPADANGSTKGLFKLNFVNNSGWKVKSVYVQ